jgi:hypothetical protein
MACFARILSATVRLFIGVRLFIFNEINLRKNSLDAGSGMGQSQQRAHEVRQYSESAPIVAILYTAEFFPEVRRITISQMTE